MVIIFECDTRKHDGRRFAWRPMIFRGTFMGRRTWRVGWGLWSISLYRSPGLRDFFDYVQEGNTTWHPRPKYAPAEPWQEHG